MPIIFSGKYRQISYDNGKFYSQTKTMANVNFLPNPGLLHEITPLPATFSNLEANDGKPHSIAILKVFGNDCVYKRYLDKGTWVYEQCDDIQNTATWAPIDPQHQAAIANYFAWADIQAKPFSFASANDFPPDGPLNNGRKAYINNMILSGLPDCLDELIKNCKSKKEYTDCLKHLIDRTQPYPQNLLPETKSVLDNLVTYFDNQNATSLGPLNNSQHYDGHFATVGEQYTYIRAIFIDALKAQEPTYQAPPLQLQGDQWNRLSIPTPAFNQQLHDPNELKHAQTILHAIAAIHRPAPTAPYGIKENVTQQQLQEALKAFNDLNKMPYDSLYHYLRPFLEVINYHDGNPRNLLNPDNKTFLAPLHTAAKNALIQLNQTTQLPAPTPQQFVTLTADNWGGVNRRASRADIVAFQRQHPNAILLLPDNFKDAGLADNRRHLREKKGGLAGPMGPRRIENIGTDQNPIYDLCTLGIPTGGKPAPSTIEDQKKEAQKRFARLYGELRRGRTVAFPKSEGTWAFGGGAFPHSALTVYIKAEINKMQDFCHNSLALTDLDQIYQDAWNNPTEAPLPIPAPELAKLGPADTVPPPAPRPEQPQQPEQTEEENAPASVQSSEKLTGANLRPQFQKWFQDNHSKPLTYDERKQTLHGFLPGAIDLVIHGNKILVNKPGGPLTAAELKSSITQAVRMHKEVNGNKPLKAIGKTEEERKIIRQIIRDEGVPLLKEPPAKKAAESKTPEQPESGGMQLRT